MLGYNDARNPEAAPGRPWLVDASLDEAVGHLVAHIRDFKPELVVGHDAFGQLTGHPDHVRTHQITLLAVEAAGLAHRYPDTGPPWQPYALYAATRPEPGVGLLRPLPEGGLIQPSRRRPRPPAHQLERTCRCCSSAVAGPMRTSTTAGTDTAPDPARTCYTRPLERGKRNFDRAR
ncbi:hypothetical protein ACH44C_11745 [Streptomyces purpureus]|uniref:hypothetical protein n=1 Tax=Streptomyces purpureus TaxID=1951 RepID=UPI0037A75830